MDLKNDYGFTLTELLVAIVIMSIIAAVGFSSYLGFKNKKVTEAETNKIVATVRETMERSKSQEDGMQWGIHFENPTGSGNDFYQVWKGASYASGIIVSKIALNSEVKFTDPLEGASKDVIFTKATGLPAAYASIVIASSNGNTAGTINVSTSGRVSYLAESGLMGYWRFDEGSGTVANDSSANSNTGSLTGPIWQTSSSCKQGGCLFFDGGDIVTAADSGSLNIQTNAFTISAWFKPNVNVTSMANAFPILVIKRPWLVGGYAAHFVKANGDIIVQYCSPGSCPSKDSTTVFSGATWYHYAGTFDGDKLRVYINGVLEGTSGSQTVTMGSSAGTSLTIGQNYEGTIDEVRVYNRALSADEVKEIYDATR